MNRMQWAEDELKRSGLLDTDSDYGGAAGKAVLELIETFSKQGHSGGSAWLVLEAFDRLARWKPLTPLTSSPDEWFDVSDVSGKPMWQSKRKPSSFSGDGGKTWYDLDDPEETARGGGMP